jgi:epoxyqueuosine reductase QueG
MDHMDSALTRDVRYLAIQQGASLVGIGTPERFDGAPKGHHPRDIVKGARSVVTFGIRIPWLASNWPTLGMASESEIIPPEGRFDFLQDYFYLTVGYDFINDRLNQIALFLTNSLEDRGYLSIYFPATYGKEYHRFQEMTRNTGPFSQRHAAVLCGLAEFGLINVAVTPQYGPRIRFNSVITEAPLEPNSRLREKVCLGEDCRACVDQCSPGAISPLPDIDSETFWLSPPSRTDIARCQQSRNVHYCRGKCIRVCPVGREGNVASFALGS